MIDRYLTVTVTKKNKWGEDLKIFFISRYWMHGILFFLCFQIHVKTWQCWKGKDHFNHLTTPTNIPMGRHANGLLRFRMILSLKNNLLRWKLKTSTSRGLRTVITTKFLFMTAGSQRILSLEHFVGIRLRLHSALLEEKCWWSLLATTLRLRRVSTRLLNSRRRC